MKTNTRLVRAVLLSALLALSLVTATAAAGKDEGPVAAPFTGPGGAPASSVDLSLLPVEPVPDGMVGNDLRTRRGYVSGLISKEKEIYVLYFLFDNGVLAVYRNEPSMEPLLQVDLSSSPDPRAAEAGIVFKDLNGDGYNDLKIPVAPGKWKTWHWNPAEGNFQEK